MIFRNDQSYSGSSEIRKCSERGLESVCRVYEHRVRAQRRAKTLLIHSMLWSVLVNVCSHFVSSCSPCQLLVSLIASTMDEPCHFCSRCATEEEFFSVVPRFPAPPSSRAPEHPGQTRQIDQHVSAAHCIDHSKKQNQIPSVEGQKPKILISRGFFGR